MSAHAKSAAEDIATQKAWDAAAVESGHMSLDAYVRKYGRTDARRDNTDAEFIVPGLKGLFSEGSDP